MKTHAALVGLSFMTLASGLVVDAQVFSTSRVSVSSQGAQAKTGFEYLVELASSVSGDGRYVLFNSESDQLVPNDTNGVNDLFVHDQLTGQTVRVSVGFDGRQANAFSAWASISADGRFICFASPATNLVPGDSGIPPSPGSRQTGVFLRDRDTDGNGVFDEVPGSTTRKIAALAFEPMMSADARVVVSHNQIIDLITGLSESYPALPGLPYQYCCAPGSLSGEARHILVLAGQSTPDGLRNLYVYDRTARRYSTISVSSTGDPANAQSSFGWIDRSGRFVAFESYASNLVPGDTNGKTDIFLRDRDVDADGVFDEPGQVSTTRISQPDQGGAATFPGPEFGQTPIGSVAPAISWDGRFVTYYSYATNLATPVTDWPHLYIYDRVANRTSLLSTASDGLRQAFGGSVSATGAAISASGRVVVFSSRSANLVPGDTNNEYDVFAHDRLAYRIDGEGGGAGALAVATQFPAVSGDGRWTSFSSPATSLVPDDTNGVADVFIRDRLTTVVTRLSAASSGVQGSAASTRSSPDRSGRFVAFSSIAANLVDGDGNGVSDIFVRDRDDDGDGVFDEPGAVRTSRVSVTTDGLSANAASDRPDITADGAIVAFASAASNLAIGDTNGATDVFVHTRATRATLRVSVATDGTQGIGASDAPSVSATGRFVAFESAAANLVAGDTNGVSDVFVRDRDSDGNGLFDEPGGVATTRVSVGPGGLQSVAASTGAAISGDGRFVAFASSASNLVAGDTNSQTDVFVHDRLSAQTTRVSVGTLRSGVAAQGNGGSDSAAISADGVLVAFRSTASSLVTDDTNGVADIFLHNRSLGQTTRVSLRRDGTQTDGPSFAPAMSEDGRRIVYGTTTLGGARPQDRSGETAGDTEAFAARGPNPVFTAMAPQRLPLAGGVLTFAGAEFTAGLTVEVGGVPATGVQVLSGGRLRATAPASAAGSRDVVVKDGDGRAVAFLSRGLTYAAQPACATGLSVTTVQLSAAAGSAALQVTSASDCGYIASTAAPWITLSGDTGGAAGTLTLQLSANASRIARTAAVLVNERTIAVTQLGIYGTDTDNDGMPDGFETLFGVSDPAADADGDGVTNRAEYEQGTDPTLPNVWNLSEGATGFFAERLALANPGIEDAEFSVRFLREGSAPIDRSYVLPAQRRLTIDVNAIDGLANEAVSAVVTTTRGGVVVERTMRWDARDGTFYGGHTGKAITAPRTQWYLAEGEARFFDTYILLANPGSTAAEVTAQYLLESGTTVTRQYTVDAQARVTIYANTIPGVTGNAFSTDVKSDVPIAVERAMYFSTGGRFWNGGHEVAAVAAPAPEWFVAEGRTGPFFDEYLLLANPAAAAVSATIRFLKPDGSVVTATRTLAATSRTTIHVDGIAGLADTDVSAAITATGPIIVERAMYWPDPFVSWYEAHASAGVTQSAVKWVLAEGETGGTLNYQTFVLLANPSATAATVRLTYLRKDAAPLTRDVTVPANGRLTTSAAQVALASGEQFGVVVESLNEVPIVVERALYWDALGQFWGAGTNETAVRIR